LSGSSNYGGLIRRSALLPFSRNLEFIKKYPIKAIFELKNDPTLGTFIISARMLDIVSQARPNTMCHMSHGIGPQITEGLKKIYIAGSISK
jgi:hypothetical protein